MIRYVEALESRRMFSAEPSADLLAVEAAREAAPGAEADGVVTIQWQGRQVTMREGQWIVGFQTATVEYIGPHLTPEQIAAAQVPYDALGLGIQFMQYLGSKDLALIKVPSGVTVRQLGAALSTMDGFLFFEPNIVTQQDVDPPSQVTAFIRQGVLIIRGDSGSNTLRIEPDAETGGLRVVGLKGTTINDGEDALVFTGVTQGVRVKLGGGRDALEIAAPDSDVPAPLTLAGDVTVNAGRGRDLVELRGVLVEGDLRVHGAGGSNWLRVVESEVRGATFINCGASRDTVNIYASTFGGRVLVWTGGSDDTITTGVESGATFASGLLVRDGSGEDMVDGAPA